MAVEFAREKIMPSKQLSQLGRTIGKVVLVPRCGSVPPLRLERSYAVGVQIRWRYLTQGYAAALPRRSPVGFVLERFSVPNNADGFQGFRGKRAHLWRTLETQHFAFRNRFIHPDG